MPRITIQDVKTTLGITETYDIVNAIRNSNPLFQQYVPLATAENIAEVGQGILVNQTLQNDFITALVDRIGLVVVRMVSLRNPLGKFKKGMLTQGRTIEEIYTDLVPEHIYDPEDAEQTVFKRSIPNVKVLFHERNRQSYYPQTISDEQLRSAFVSWNAFENFLTSVLNAVYNSAEVDEFKYMKLLIDNYYSKGLFTVVPTVKPDTETAAKEFIKKVREIGLRMTLPFGSRDFNALAVHTVTQPEDLHLIITAKLRATVDVDVLASAFNIDRTDFMGQVTVVDSFASPGLEAVLIDRNWYMVYDQLQKMETIRNPKGMYWNYFYHVWQVLSASRFANAVAFVSDAVDPVTQVIVDPPIAALKPGQSKTFTAYVRATDGQDHDVTWSVEGRNGTTVQSGTTISSNGVLTVDPAQTGELLVKATTTFDVDGQSKDVIGESVVTIVPSVQ